MTQLKRINLLSTVLIVPLVAAGCAVPQDGAVSSQAVESAKTVNQATRFERVGQAVLPDGTPDTLAFSKLAPWPDTDGSVFYTGCYDPAPMKEAPWTDRCFAVLDVSDPTAPKQLSAVPGYDPVKSPSPSKDHMVWKTDYPFPNLPAKAPCYVDWNAPAIAAGTQKPACFDPGWNTHTHYVGKGPNGLLAVNQEGYRLGTHRQPAYHGVKFYDVSDPADPKYLSYWESDGSAPHPVTGRSQDTHGTHHFNFNGQYLHLGSTYKGYVGKIFVTLDLSDPTAPKETAKWALPGQKTPEEDAIRNWQQQPKFNSPVIQLEDGKWRKHVGMHYVSTQGDTAYLSYHQGGLVILDISDKSNPKLLSHTDYLLPDAQVNSPDRVACTASGGGVPTACGNAHSAKVVPGRENLLIMTDEYFSCPFGHMRIFDVSNPQAPKILSQLLLEETTQCDPANPSKSLYADRYPNRGPSTHIGNTMDNDLFFVAWYGAGVRAVDISDPTAPTIVAEYTYSMADDYPDVDSATAKRLTGMDTYDVIRGPDDLYYVSDGSAGLRVLKFNPGTP